MNSIDPQSPVGQPNNTTPNQTDSPDRGKSADNDHGPAFSQVLAKKRQPLAGAERAKPGKGELPDAMDMGLMPAKNTFDQPLDVSARRCRTRSKFRLNWSTWCGKSRWASMPPAGRRSISS